MPTPVEPNCPECEPTEAHMQIARDFVANHGEQNEVIDSGGQARLEWSPTHTTNDVARLLASQEAKLRAELHEAFAKEAKEVTDEVIARMEKDRVENEALRARLEAVLSHLDPDGDCDTDIEIEQLSRFVLRVLDAHVSAGEQGAQGEVAAVKEECVHAIKDLLVFARRAVEQGYIVDGDDAFGPAVAFLSRNDEAAKVDADLKEIKDREAEQVRLVASFAHYNKATE